MFAQSLGEFRCLGLKRHQSADVPRLFLAAPRTGIRPYPLQPQLHSQQQLCLQRTVKAAAASAAAAGDGASNSSGVAPSAQTTTVVKAPLDFTKIAVLGFMFFISCFNYTILQSLKDALVVTQMGAEALPFLGAYGVLPGSILFFLYYGWVTKNFPERLHYYGALAPLLAFYGAFAFVLYPIAPALHPYHLLDSLKAMLPDGLVGLAGVVVNWLYSVFFIIAELWGAVAISMLFWGLADDVCTMDEAKNVYPSLGMIANVGLICAGAFIKFVNKNLTGGSALTSMRWLVTAILVSSAGMAFLKNFVDNRYLAGEHAKAEAEGAEKKKKDKKKPKSEEGEAADPGALKSAQELLKRSPKVANLAVLVTAYFVVQKLFDYAWLAQLRVQYPDNTAFQSALADVSQLTGFVTIGLMATSKYAFKFLGWGGTALATPAALLIMGGVFFASVIVTQHPEMFGPAIASVLIPIGAAAGVAGRVLSKASKYSLFDPSKEMVFITMSKQEKTEGKAAVDLLGSYFGKTGASWMMQIMVLFFGTLARSMPVLFAVHVAVCAAWTKSTLSLAGLMRREEEGIAAAEAKALAEEAAAEAAPEYTVPDVVKERAVELPEPRSGSLSSSSGSLSSVQTVEDPDVGMVPGRPSRSRQMVGAVVGAAAAAGAAEGVAEMVPRTTRGRAAVHVMQVLPTTVGNLEIPFHAHQDQIIRRPGGRGGYRGLYAGGDADAEGTSVVVAAMNMDEVSTDKKALHSLLSDDE